MPTPEYIGEQVRKAEELLDLMSTPTDMYVVVNGGGTSEHVRFCCEGCPLVSANLYMVAWHANETGHSVRMTKYIAQSGHTYTSEELQALYDEWHPTPKKTPAVQGSV